MIDNNNYLKAIVITHGKSEKRICEHIKSNLRLNIHIASEKNGKSSIQITSLLKFLGREEYKSLNKFLNKFGEQLPPNKKKLPDDFKIFTIMDTDDCSEIQKINYINKTMFKHHWAFNYIHPIYNINNLEDVMRKIGIPIIDKKRDYIKIFPINSNGEMKDIDQIKKLNEKLIIKKEITNMSDFIEFCIQLV